MVGGLNLGGSLEVMHNAIDVVELAELIGRIRVFTEILAATPKPIEGIDGNAE